MIPKHGRLAGIDFGTVRIGISISDADRILASPLETYTRKTDAADADYFRQLVGQEAIVGFVVGLPVHTSGEESAKSLEARQFGAWLSEITDRPVSFWDERYTTVEAEQLLNLGNLRGKRRKAKLDRVAAQIILSTFIESERCHSPKPEPLDDE